MPAPHRRSHGPSLATKIDAKTSSRALDDRSKVLAARTRHAKKFEEVSAALEAATGSALERKAAETRRDYERGRQFQHFDNDVKRGRAKPPIVVLTPDAAPRYWLGHCLDCSVELWVHRPKPRVPLCTRCRDRRS